MQKNELWSFFVILGCRTSFVGLRAREIAAAAVAPVHQRLGQT